MAFRTKKKTRRKTKSQKDRSFAWQIIKGILRFLGLIVLIICTYYITRLPSLTITEIKIEGGETISHDTLRELASLELEGTYFRLIPKRFAYLYPKERITYVLEEVPRVHSVDISRFSGKALKITFDEYVPHALWCNESSSNTPCYFLDETGFAFSEAPILHGGTFIRHFVTNHDDYKLGDVIKTETLKAIDTFIKQSEEVLNFRINSLNHMSDGDISFMVNGGGIIITSLKKELVVTLENIAAVLNSEEFKHIEPGNFQYIDARFENKIFVNENLEVASTTSEELPE